MYLSVQYEKRNVFETAGYCCCKTRIPTSWNFADGGSYPRYRTGEKTRKKLLVEPLNTPIVAKW